MSGPKARAGLAVLLAVLLGSAWPAPAQQDSSVLFRNVRIFDGKSGALSAASNVLVRNSKIEKISTVNITADASKPIDTRWPAR